MNILVIDDEINIREILKEILEDEKHTVFTAPDGKEGLEILNQEKVNLCFLDVWMPVMGGIEVLKKIKDDYSEIEVVMISGHAKIDLAVKATQLGAYDFLEKPLTIEKILGIVKSIENMKNPKPCVKNIKNDNSDKMIGSSIQMQAVRLIIENSAKSDARILILGSNGTGKELVAREIHLNSNRKSNPFIAINCAAIPENLIESELFGHVKGSFTGASSDKTGKFEMANGGTLFLDEIGDMSLGTQAKVLRALQEMKIMRIGGVESETIDVRVISATNKDLKEEIKNNNFREDLFYRLNVIPINLPSLSERKDDIPELVEYFNIKISNEVKTSKKIFSKDALEFLKNYSWPGNIRQLRNIIERILIMITGETVCLSDVKNYLDTEADEKKDENFITKYSEYKLNTAIDEFEKDFIEKKLQENGFNISKTARVLGVYPSNLYSKINKLGIEMKENKNDC